LRRDIPETKASLRWTLGNTDDMQQVWESYHEIKHLYHSQPDFKGQAVRDCEAEIEKKLAKVE
jgi:hypothetical protein